MADPVIDLQRLRERAIGTGDPNGSTCTLATVSEDGAPRARTVILHEVQGRSFALFCSAQSGKWRDLATMPQVELVLWWPTVRVQVRVRGPIRELDTATVEAQWRETPYEHRLLDSYYEQGKPLGASLDDRTELLEGVERLRQRYLSPELIPAPAHLRGFVCEADWIEVLRVELSRLHECEVYRWGHGSWARSLHVP